MCIHTVYSSALKNATSPNVPLAKRATGLSKSQACFINKVVAKVGKYRQAQVSVQKLTGLKISFFGNYILILYHLLWNMLTLPYWSQAYRSDSIRALSPKEYFCT